MIHKTIPETWHQNYFHMTKIIRGPLAAFQHLVLYVIALVVISAPAQVLASVTKPSIGLDEAAKSAGAESGITRTPSISALIGEILGAVLGLVGVVFLILVIYAGFLWMTARGNTEQVTKAKNLFSGAIIGLVIVVSAYYLVDYLFGIIETSVTE